MVSDKLGKMLHDKATRGKLLSTEEQSQLESWYEYQDGIESNILKTNAGEKSISKLQSQVEAALIQLARITRRIQEVASENETLRQENSHLRRQLIDTTMQQVA